MRLTIGVLVALLAALSGAAPAQATVPQTGYGLGISDPDPIPANSLRERFAALRPKTFRVIVDWNVVDNPPLKAQVAARLDRARAAGVREVVVAFGGPAAYVAPEAWIAKVGAFVDEFSAQVSAWSPVNEPNYNPGGVPNWLATTPHSPGPAPSNGYGVEVLARYSVALSGFLAVRHPEDRLLSPDLHDDYDGDLSDGTPLRTVVEDGERVSTVADYLRHFRAAGGELGVALAWHPYSGVNRRDMTSTEDIAEEIPGLPIWVTEIGAAGQIPGGRFERAGEAYQEQTVDWMLGSRARLPSPGGAPLLLAHARPQPRVGHRAGARRRQPASGLVLLVRRHARRRSDPPRLRRGRPRGAAPPRRVRARAGLAPAVQPDRLGSDRGRVLAGTHRAAGHRARLGALGAPPRRPGVVALALPGRLDPLGSRGGGRRRRPHHRHGPGRRRGHVGDRLRRGGLDGLAAAGLRAWPQVRGLWTQGVAAPG